MLSWFRKRVVPGCSVKHYKGAGEKMDDRMVEVLRWTEYDHVKLHLDGYRIFQCTECGKRAYMGFGHCMGPITTDMIDRFIRHELDLEPLLKRFRHMKYRFIVYHKYIKENKDAE